MTNTQTNGHMVNKSSEPTGCPAPKDKTIGVSEATQVTPGLMTAEDLCKLQSLVIPPPTITLTSDKCGTRIKGGVISLVAGDQYIKVDSFVNIKQNEDGTAPSTYELVPLKIYENTYGIRFSLDIDKLSFTLIRNDKLRIRGETGKQGVTGKQGDAGVNYILSGPKGRKGATGSTPPIPQTLQAEGVDTVTVGSTAITSIRPVINSDGTYDMVVTRQPIGNANVSTSNVKFGSGKSSWAVVVRGAGAGQKPYYMDVNPIITAIHDRATGYANLIRQGYEDATKFWIETMSDLFDAQKQALCCALERCESHKKNLSLQQHWEMVSATAKPDYKAIMRPRAQATKVGAGTGVLDEIYGTTTCVSGDPSPPDPKPPKPPGPTPPGPTPPGPTPPGPTPPGPTPPGPTPPGPTPIDPNKGINIDPMHMPSVDYSQYSACIDRRANNYVKSVKPSSDLDIILLLPYGKSFDPLRNAFEGVRGNSNPVATFLSYLEELTTYNTWSRLPRVGVIAYNDNTIEVLPFTPISDRLTIQGALAMRNFPQEQRSTVNQPKPVYLAKAIETAVQSFKDAGGSTGTRIISLFGDYANSSGGARISDAIRAAQTANVNIMANVRSTDSTPVDGINWFNVLHYDALCGNTGGVNVIDNIAEPRSWGSEHFFNVITSLSYVLPSRLKNGAVNVNPLISYTDGTCVANPLYSQTKDKPISIVVDCRSSMGCAVTDLSYNKDKFNSTMNNGYPTSQWGVHPWWPDRDGTQLGLHFPSSGKNMPIFYAGAYQSARINKQTDDLLREIMYRERHSNNKKPSVLVWVTDRPFSANQEELTQLADGLNSVDITFVGVHVDSRAVWKVSLDSPAFDSGAGCWEDTATQLNYLAQATNGVYSRSVPTYSAAGHIYGTQDGVTNAVLLAIKNVCAPTVGTPMPPAPTVPTIPPFAANVQSVAGFKVNNIIKILFELDARLNSGYATSGVQFDLPRGKYLAQIESSSAQIGDKFTSPVRVSYKQGMSTKMVDFVDKGEYDDPEQGALAVEGSTIAVNHGGGLMKFFVPSVEAQNDNKGKITISIVPQILFLDRALIDDHIDTKAIMIAGVSFPISFDGDPGSDVVRFKFNGSQLVPTKHNE